jgi:nucleoid DNA-binding protein
VDITAHIRELLFGHDCVIIPEFGGFICNYSPARIDKANGTFYPPVKKVSFNRNLNHNDGLLIKKISGSSGMNYGDTRDMIAQYVTDLKKKLEHGEKVNFEHIGSFVNNHEGNVQFEPDESVNYNLDAYGFEPFQCMPLEGYDVRKRISINSSGNQRHIIRRYLWRAAVIVPIAAAIIAVSLKVDLLKSKVEATSMNPLATAEFELNKAAIDNNVAKLAPEVTVPADTSPVDTSSIVSEKTIVAPAMVAEVKSEPSIAEEAPKITEKNSYYIITGSFQSKENAGKQISQLQAEGFNPEVVAAGNGFYRVCAIECPDLSTAVSKKDSILSKFPGAWISRKK